ncbi:Similar to Cellobiose dehydrogenase; acc. no. Q01738 [Pyronema omphalodes CBS 100304]|uniref:Similar to Cellobiose dehydrogenase acc. no. Q01738 n=1 Tax=Pyronema omphalodes (strain CBS 100304) TaxID=1076935 RepID=U4KWD3_PYROM|nr:Similar to Cellobiose dehydrogenase; acc. no. Q01738 [Pyronema omphalodes CBS 100304]
MDPLSTSKGALPPTLPRYRIQPVKRQNLAMRYLAIIVLLIFLIVFTRGRVASAADWEWDYIIVGTGPAGSMLSSRLSASGARVLILEAGHPSTYATGGRSAPTWLRNSGEKLSRFDVPGFFNAFTAHPDGHQCPDIPFPAGCILGGGSAVNSGIWFLPAKEDWEGMWEPSSMIDAIRRTRERIPGTENPSRDGRQWFDESFEVFGGMLKGMGWREVKANKEEGKDRTFSRTNFMGDKGERGGPVERYMLEALGRAHAGGNVEIRYGARVERVLRKGGKVTGVEYLQSGERKTVGVGKKGKVVLSAGAFGTAKILWGSGVGTKDQLSIMKAARGDRMITSTEWIDLPVGYNLQDHPATYAVFRYPGITPAYNYSGAYETPPKVDADNYLLHRSGPLASSNARISLWHKITGSDGISRTMQWAGRTSDAGNFTDTDLLLMTAYITHGQTSRGRIGLTPNLTHQIIVSPYLTSKEDISALTESFQTLLPRIAEIKGIEMLQPDLSKTSISDFVHNYNLPRGSNHWSGTAAMGKVVDNETRVKGLKNLVS